MAALHAAASFARHIKRVAVPPAAGSRPGPPTKNRILYWLRLLFTCYTPRFAVRAFHLAPPPPDLRVMPRNHRPGPVAPAAHAIAWSLAAALGLRLPACSIHARLNSIPPPAAPTLPPDARHSRQLPRRSRPSAGCPRPDACYPHLMPNTPAAHARRPTFPPAAPPLPPQHLLPTPRRLLPPLDARNPCPLLPPEARRSRQLPRRSRPSARCPRPDARYPRLMPDTLARCSRPTPDDPVRCPATRRPCPDARCSHSPPVFRVRCTVPLLACHPFRLPRLCLCSLPALFMLHDCPFLST
ncbi:hypothetical protein B0H11DRAFT_2430857 [Mycena galericulata]|nr:hypothetical protein B0H11DRAFT_2430857 [Mycena galericulata]